MKALKIIATITVFLFVGLITAHIIYLSSMTAKETYNTDTYLDTVSRKIALIITAHDDDAFTCSGTVAKLISSGWQVRQICFKDKNEDKAVRFAKASAALHLSGYDLLSVRYRNVPDSGTALYMPIPYDRFADLYNRDSVLPILSSLIAQYNPAVIFSLDDSIGGYGNPDHVFISKLVVDYCQQHSKEPGFGVKKIYQAVFPPSMAEAIIVKNSWSKINPYIAAKELYHCNGMPLPNTEINISRWAGSKKAYMECFGPHDQRNIKKFAPGYNFYPAWLYFRIFSKEYFRVIETNNL